MLSASRNAGLPIGSEHWDWAGRTVAPTTITDAVISTAALLREYNPEKRVTERRLLVNVGVMSLAEGLFGAMPMRHGAGGFADQHYWVTRTGGPASWREP